MFKQHLTLNVYADTCTAYTWNIPVGKTVSIRTEFWLIWLRPNTAYTVLRRRPNTAYTVLYRLLLSLCLSVSLFILTWELDLDLDLSSLSLEEVLDLCPLSLLPPWLVLYLFNEFSLEVLLCLGLDLSHSLLTLLFLFLWP